MESFIELESHLNLLGLGAAMLIFFIFIPFFAFKELVGVLGKDKIHGLLIKKQNCS